MFNTENAIDSHPYNAYRIPEGNWNNGITFDPYVPPGEEESENGDESEEG